MSENVLCVISFLDKGHTRAVVVEIVWYLDIQLSMDSVPIHSHRQFESSSWRGVLDTTLCNKVCQWLVAGGWFSLGTLVSSTNKTDRHDIAEILLKLFVKHANQNAIRSSSITWRHTFFTFLNLKSLDQIKPNNSLDGPWVVCPLSKLCPTYDYGQD